MWEVGLYSAIAPWILLLLSSVWLYPAGLEEVVKWLILKWTMDDGRWTMRSGAVVGIVFGLSESVLYMTNAWMSGQWGVLGQRLLLTVPMHILTAMVTVWGMRHKMGWVGLGLA